MSIDNALENKYMFPVTGLSARPTQDLLNRINLCMRDALDMTDGNDIHSDVRIDCAQDEIEQARDILVNRGHIFTEEQRDQMRFLSWPMTPEQQARRDADEDYRLEQLEQRKIVQAQMRVLVCTLIEGQPIPLGLNAADFHLSIGDSSPSHAPWAFTGRVLLDIQQKYTDITNLKAHLSYCCSRFGIKFEDDPAPGWSLHFPLTGDPKFWALISQFLQKNPYLNTSVWDQRNGVPVAICFEILHDLDSRIRKHHPDTAPPPAEPAILASSREPWYSRLWCMTRLNSVTKQQPKNVRRPRP